MAKGKCWWLFASSILIDFSSLDTVYSSIFFFHYSHSGTNILDFFPAMMLMSLSHGLRCFPTFLLPIFGYKCRILFVHLSSDLTMSLTQLYFRFATSRLYLLRERTNLSLFHLILFLSQNAFSFYTFRSFLYFFCIIYYALLVKYFVFFFR